MPISGVRVVVFGRSISIPQYQIVRVDRPQDILGAIASLDADVVVTCGADLGILKIAPAELRRRWVSVPENASNSVIAERVDACYQYNIWNGSDFDRNNPLVTVYTPTKDPGSYLEEAYDSLKWQTYVNWEWVLVDDFSTDGTWELIRELAKSDRRIRGFQLARASGRVGETKQAATLLARGEYVVELDHDDMLTEDCLQEIKSAFQEYPEVGFVYGNSANVFEDWSAHKFNDDFWRDRYREVMWRGRKVVECLNPNIYDRFGNHFADQFGWFLTVGPNHPRAFRTSVLRELGGYNPSLPIADDWDVMARMFLRSRCHHIEKMLYIYRFRDRWTNTTFTRNQSIQDHLELGRKNYSGEFDSFNQKRLSGEWSPITGNDRVCFVSAARTEADAAKLRSILSGQDVFVAVGATSIFQAYEQGRQHFSGRRRIVYLHDDVSFSDLSAFLTAVHKLPVGLHGVCGSDSDDVRSRDWWWEAAPLVGRVVQDLGTHKKVLDFSDTSRALSAKWLDGLCLVTVGQNWSWLLPGNPSLWHGYDWLACKRTEESRGRCWTMPQPIKPAMPFLVHAGHGRTDGLHEAMQTVRALSRPAQDRRDYPNIHEHLDRLRSEAHGVVLELGSRDGTSTAVLLEGVCERGGEVWSVDIDPQYANAWHGHPRWHFVQADSCDTTALAAHGLPQQIDVLFIDSDHTYDRTKKELVTWLPRVRAGGVVILHDTESFPDVKRAVIESVNERGLSVEFRDNCNGLGIVRIPLNLNVAIGGDVPQAAPSSNKLIVSFTTLPSRISNIGPMVDSLLKQTIKPEEIRMYVPHRSIKENCDYPQVEFSGVRVVRCDDFGPATKLIPCLLEESDLNTTIVTVDDDVVYDVHMLEDLLVAANEHPQAAIGLMGTMVGGGYVHGEMVVGSQPVGDILGGYRGVLYRRSFFDVESLIAQLRASGEPFLADDHLFSLHVRSRGHDLRVAQVHHHNNALSIRFLNLGNSIFSAGDPAAAAVASAIRVQNVFANLSKNNSISSSLNGASNVSFVVLDAGSGYATRCLRSIREFAPGAEIILVGNGVEPPADPTLSDKRIIIYENVGFSAGCNRACIEATRDLICFMNDDAMFVDAETPARLSATAAASRTIVGPFSDRAKPPQGDVPRQSRPDGGIDQELPMVVGLCMMMQRKFFMELGGFDPRLLTYDDDDLCRRAWMAGGSCKVVGGTWVQHERHATFKHLGIDPNVTMQENAEIFAKKWPKIKVVCIAKDEERALPGFLSQWNGIADACCVLDTGSSDKTIELAALHGAKVDSYPFVDFADARNEAARRFGDDADWIIALDPDERLSPWFLPYLRELLATTKYDVLLAPLEAISADGSRRLFVPKPFAYRAGHGQWSFKVHEKLLGADGSKYALVQNISIEHHLALHEGQRRSGAEQLYGRLMSQEPYFQNASYRDFIRNRYPILDYDRVDDPRIDKITCGPLVSVIIPTYKRPELLANAVASALDQDYEPLEVVVVSDGVPSNLTIIGNGSLRVRVFDLKRNYGAGGAVPRNIGIMHSAGELIAYLDDDNEWKIDHVSSIVSEMLRLNADWGFSSMHILGKDLIASEPKLGDVDTSCLVHNGNMIVKHGWWKSREEAGTYAHDWEFMSRMISDRWIATKKPTLLYNAETSGQLEYLRQKIKNL